MQTTTLFNTHAFIKALTEAGMDEKQAEVLADHQLAILETYIATKADIVDLKEGQAAMQNDLAWIKKLLIGIGMAVFVAAIKYIFA